ncbi:MAG: hypothetical protein IIB17_04655, partial [Chloroflexi bacterium]|nr:hypothetical protein [Chloroflexota bacterium]
RISYLTATDIRVAGITTFSMESIADEEQRFLSAIPGATGVSLALRQDTRAGAVPTQVLAIDSLQFPYITWYRDDFSDLSVTEVMGNLRSSARIERMEVPEDATSLGVWVNPREEIPNTSMWFIVQERNGRLSSLPAGIVGAPGWQLLEAQLPSWMSRPVNLVSVQLFEAGAGDVTTAGQMLIALDLLLGPTAEIVLCGEQLDEVPGSLRRRFIPNKVVACGRPESPGRGQRTSRAIPSDTAWSEYS